MHKDFPSKVQNFIANSFSSSTIRNMVSKGGLESIQQFLKTGINLDDLCKKDASDYAAALNELTEGLLRALPEPDQKKWGLARKSLNLFFRDALYNFYLRETYDLKKFEAELEIPLDSHVGKELKNLDPALPVWTTVIGLTCDQSTKFQESALKIANRQGIHRVHLDIYYWRGSKTHDTTYVDLATLKRIP